MRTGASQRHEANSALRLRAPGLSGRLLHLRMKTDQALLQSTNPHMRVRAGFHTFLDANGTGNVFGLKYAALY